VLRGCAQTLPEGILRSSVGAPLPYVSHGKPSGRHGEGPTAGRGECFAANSQCSKSTLPQSCSAPRGRGAADARVQPARCSIGRQVLRWGCGLQADAGSAGNAGSAAQASVVAWRHQRGPVAPSPILACTHGSDMRTQLWHAHTALVCTHGSGMCTWLWL